MTISEIINNRIQQRVLTHLHTDTYRCGCGSVLVRSSIQAHLRTKKHQSWEEQYVHLKSNVFVIDGKECEICYNKQFEFKKCKVCKNSICQHCASHVTKCPFCRTSLDLSWEQHDEFERQYTSYMHWVHNAPVFDISQRLHMFCENVIHKYLDTILHNHYHQVKRELKLFLLYWSLQNRHKIHFNIMAYYYLLN